MVFLFGSFLGQLSRVLQGRRARGGSLTYRYIPESAFLAALGSSCARTKTVSGMGIELGQSIFTHRLYLTSTAVPLRYQPAVSQEYRR